MKRVALAALVALGACKQHDREHPRSGAVVATADAAEPEATPRARPSELAHLTLKVLGMT